MLLFFIIGVLLILLCAVSVLRRHQNQRCAVLLVAYDLPTTRIYFCAALYSRISSLVCLFATNRQFDAD